MDNIEILGENLDTLAYMEIAKPRGLKRKLYEAARAKDEKSCTYTFATGLQDNVDAKDTVIIACGSVSHPWMPLGETDGPPGAAILARAIDLGLLGKPVVICEEVLVDMVKATFLGAGLSSHSLDDMKKSPHSVTIFGFPTDEEKAKIMSEKLLDDLSPAAVIAVEKMGPNRKGVHHSVRGYDVSALRAKAYHLFEKAASEGIFTGGIGDGGNEIGFGKIFDEARKIFPTGSKCNCPCEDGIVTRIATDALVIAGASNHGAYAVAACLAALLNKNEVYHNVDIERRMMSNCINAGAVDGSTTMNAPTVDGISESGNLALVEIFKTMIEFPREPGTRERYGLV